MNRVASLGVLLLVGWPNSGDAQDVLVLAPPEMPAILEDLDRPEGADALRLGVQFDTEKEVELLTINFAGTAVWRPPQLTHAAGDLRARPQLALRLRSPPRGPEDLVARRTVTSGSEVSLEAAYSVEVHVAGPVWAIGRVDGALGIQQGAVPRPTSGDVQPDPRLLTVGVMHGGPRVVVLVGPVLFAVDLQWHEVWLGAETFPTFERVLEDGPYVGLSLVIRFSSHLFMHGRLLPRSDDLVPGEQWTVGIAASFDPFHD